MNSDIEVNDMRASFDPIGDETAGALESFESPVREIAVKAQIAGRQFANSTRAVKDAALRAIAQGLHDASETIVAANAKDVERERVAGMTDSMIDRLRLDPDRIAAIANAVLEVASLPDPVGEIVRGSTLPQGIQLRQVRVPMGVIGMIYEARPNVTVDAAALALKSGNAAILRGGSAAQCSNEALITVIRDALAGQGLPADLVQTIDAYGREGATVLMTLRGLIDVLIPRGGAGLIRSVVQNSIVPVIETGTGNCHIYVDESANLSQALAIVVNAKTQRPSVCNAAETLLVHESVAAEFLPNVVAALRGAGVVLHLDQEALNIVGQDAGELATDTDWATEYIGLEMAIGVVASLDAAVEHIRLWSTKHTEAILTNDLQAADRFIASVDSAVVAINASTRFTDGGEFGLGAEVGVSTQKLHARGPMGLADLTTTKWIVMGDGHVRA